MSLVKYKTCFTSLLSSMLVSQMIFEKSMSWFGISGHQLGKNPLLDLQQEVAIVSIMT